MVFVNVFVRKAVLRLYLPTVVCGMLCYSAVFFLNDWAMMSCAISVRNLFKALLGSVCLSEGSGGSLRAHLVATPRLLQHIPSPGDQSHQMICGQSDLGLVSDDLKGRLWAYEV